VSSSSPTIGLQEAADRLGVHYMTAYRYVRLGVLPATKEGGSWKVSLHDLSALVASPPSRTARGEAPWSGRLEARMVAGDLAGSWGVVEAALAAGTDPSEVYSELLAPALTSIGERWASGELGIEDEHLASSVASRIIGRLGSRFVRRGRPRGRIVTATPPGERHSFGIGMLADVLRGEGYEVVDLGPDTPIESLVATVERSQPVTAVCMGIVYESVLPAAADTIAALRRRVPEVPVVVGGRAVSGDLAARRLGADAWAGTARDAVEAVASLAGRAHPA
jgi:MerR family transcriptional regulator, light-induced transcriptional regulator